MTLHIPSPPVSGLHAGPLGIHVYGLMYVIGITLAVLITRRRWSAVNGDPALVADVAIWAVPAGIIGGRIYFDLTTPKYIPHHWWGGIRRVGRRPRDLGRGRPGGGSWGLAGPPR